MADAKLNEEQSDEKNGVLYWQAAIFKVGDDVRQVSEQCYSMFFCEGGS